MQKIRAFFNSMNFIALVAIAVIGLFTHLFMMSPTKAHNFTHGNGIIITAAVALITFAVWLLMLPAGEIKKFVKSEGFGVLCVAVLAIALIGGLTYLFITA
jgi:hypothetical protein